MSAYILYQNQTIPEKWGGSLGRAVQDGSGGVVLSACCTQVAARPTTRREGLAGQELKLLGWMCHLVSV